MSTLEKAIEIASRAHAGQKLKDGMPYILHPLRIMSQVDSLEQMMVAVMHDVVEDTDVTLEDIKKAGFSEAVIEGVRLMTHDEDLSYGDYIDRLKDNTIARKVKLADMRHNIDLLRIPEVKDKDLERCRKYHQAISYLVKYEQTL